MTPIDIKQVSLTTWNTNLYYATCGDIAALILPSHTIAPGSPGHCTCDLQTGELTTPKYNKFIRESTLREMDDVSFRVFAYENAAAFDAVSHKPDSCDGLVHMLDETVSKMEEPKVMLCYGGDIVKNVNSLLSIVNIAVKHPNKQFVCKTGNTFALVDFLAESMFDNSLAPGNILIFAEDTEVEFNMVPTIKRKYAEGPLVDDFTVFPETGNNLILKLHPQSASRRRKKTSWWQPVNTKKYK